MSFTAKVKETGQLFLVAAELGPNKDRFRDTHRPVEKGNHYAGNLLEGAYPGNSPWVEFQSAVWATFPAEEIEEFDVELRLVPFR